MTQSQLKKNLKLVNKKKKKKILPDSRSVTTVKQFMLNTRLLPQFR